MVLEDSCCESINHAIAKIVAAQGDALNVFKSSYVETYKSLLKGDTAPSEVSTAGTPSTTSTIGSNVYTFETDSGVQYVGNPSAAVTIAIANFSEALQAALGTGLISDLGTAIDQAIAAAFQALNFLNCAKCKCCNSAADAIASTTMAVIRRLGNAAAAYILAYDNLLSQVIAQPLVQNDGNPSGNSFVGQSFTLNSNALLAASQLLPMSPLPALAANTYAVVPKSAYATLATTITPLFQSTANCTIRGLNTALNGIIAVSCPTCSKKREAAICC